MQIRAMSYIGMCSASITSQDETKQEPQRGTDRSPEDFC